MSQIISYVLGWNFLFICLLCGVRFPGVPWAPSYGIPGWAEEGNRPFGGTGEPWMDGS